MMGEYVSRTAALQAVGDIHPLDYNGQGIVERIKAIPAADVVEVRHGRWIKDCDRVMGDGWTYAQRHCSECGWQTVECVNYCQFCGAKMDGGQDDV